jgi:Bacterial EndoU nuclease
VARGTADSKNGDNPELPPDMHSRETARDLSARLSDLPESHPSSSGYVSDHHSARGSASSPERHQRDSPSETPASADYTDPHEIQLTADRRIHIVDGDQTGGGHRHGTGQPGKTEFPAEWGDDRITDAILAVARNPDQVPERQDWNGRWQVSGEHDGVKIFAVVESDGRVWTAWPDEGSPGVVKNAVKDN